VPWFAHLEILSLTHTHPPFAQDDGRAPLLHPVPQLSHMRRLDQRRSAGDRLAVAERGQGQVRSRGVDGGAQVVDVCGFDGGDVHGEGGVGVAARSQ